MKYGNNIHVHYIHPLFLANGIVDEDARWGECMFNIYSRRTYRLNHIFLIHPTNFANKFFFRPVHRIYQFSINSKVSRWLSRGTRKVWQKIFAAVWYNLFRVASFGEGVNKTAREIQAFRKIHGTQKGEWRRTRKRETKEGNKTRTGLRWARKGAWRVIQYFWRRDVCARSGFFFFFRYLLLSLFSTESIPDIARRTRAVWSKRITFILRLVGNAYISVPRTNNGDISVRDARNQGRF